MDRLDTLNLFTRIVELGSFSRAADGLDVPRATATHAIKALEARLGARLLERTTRHVRPTPDGQQYYERCVHLLGELAEADASLRQSAIQPRGLLRVDLHGTHARTSSCPAWTSSTHATRSSRWLSAVAIVSWTWCAKASIAWCGPGTRATPASCRGAWPRCRR